MPDHPKTNVTSITQNIHFVREMEEAFDEFEEEFEVEDTSTIKHIPKWMREEDHKCSGSSSD